MERLPFDPLRAVGGVGPGAPRGAPPGIVTVSQVTRLVKDAIETALPATLHVVGQLSNVKRHTSGHLYFTLKDERSELSCIMWRSNAERMKFAPTDGTDVLVSGTVSVFERGGRYQLYARKMEPRGLGALELAFRQLCEKLHREGLFDEKHKKPLPKYPQRVAVVTSETGAAVSDILDTLKRRYPCATVYLYPVPVQGPLAAEAIAAAVREINRRSAALGGVDVLIVGRGGGSAEDLWAFNEEAVARAIFASGIPVISAVGHETDVTVADLVADVRAATPTAAAERATPQREEVQDELAYHASVMVRGVRHRLQLSAAKVESATRRRAFADPALPVHERRRKLEELHARVSGFLSSQVHRLLRRVEQVVLILQRLHPERFVTWQKGRLAESEHRLRLVLALRFRSADRLLAARAEKLARFSPAASVAVHRHRLVGLYRRLDLAVGQSLRRAAARVEASESRLQALGYRSTLARGFSITRAGRTGQVVRSVRDLQEGDLIITEVADGSIDSQVLEAH